MNILRLFTTIRWMNSRITLWKFSTTFEHFCFASIREYIWTADNVIYLLSSPIIHFDVFRKHFMFCFIRLGWNRFRIYFIDWSSFFLHNWSVFKPRIQIYQKKKSLSLEKQCSSKVWTASYHWRVIYAENSDKIW